MTGSEGLTGGLDGAISVAHGAYVASHAASARFDQQARKVMPGGNTRSVLHFDPFPFRVIGATGSVVTDADGHDYVDFCGNYTAGLLGHSSQLVRDAVVAAMDEGFAVGATHPREIELAELVCERFAAIDQVRFTNSGTEANLMAIGTALHFNGRTGVGVFSEGYHGGVLAFGGAGSPLNVPYNYTIAPFDDLTGLDDLFHSANDLGCVVVEAVQGSGGCRPASEAFMAELSKRCTENGVILILDEVMTSRLTQAGTFNNNVVSMAAAVATLRHGLDADRLAEVNERGDQLRDQLSQALSEAKPKMWVTGRGSMLTVHVNDDRWRELYFHQMLADGHYVARRGFIALSMAITDEQIEALVASTQQWGLATNDL